MAPLVASKFNARTDPNRPKLGERIINEGGRVFRTKHVSFMLANKLMKNVREGKQPPQRDCDEVFFIQHNTRPMVYWLIWANEVQN